MGQNPNIDTHHRSGVPPTARGVAEADAGLQRHAHVLILICPAGLESHPQHEVAKKQMRGYNGMLTF